MVRKGSLSDAEDGPKSCIVSRRLKYFLPAMDVLLYDFEVVPIEAHRWIPRHDRAVFVANLRFLRHPHSLLNCLHLDYPTEIHPIVCVYCVFLTKIPCETLKEKWWRFDP